jgi:hypothetical protein
LFDADLVAVQTRLAGNCGEFAIIKMGATEITVSTLLAACHVLFLFIRFHYKKT